jgi:hypothetical protein
MATPATPMRLDELDLGDPSDEPGRLIMRRLGDRGVYPYSLCEAIISETEYTWLVDWAKGVRSGYFVGAIPYGGLVFLTFVSEWNRRNSPGDTVWQGIAEHFEHPQTRARLFNASGDPNSFTRELTRETACRFHLRHVFDREHADKMRYYLTIHLQYGFSQEQMRQNLGNWLGGHSVTAAMQRLLEPAGRYRSRSFKRLMDDLRSFRRDYLTEIDVRRMLTSCPWVLPEWHDDILVWSQLPGGDRPPPEETLEILAPPRLRWDHERGPVASSRLLDLGRFQPTDSRYHLRHEGRLLASWFRQKDLGYFADRSEVELPPDRPQAVVQLEDASGESLVVQTLTIWDEVEDVQVLPLGRMIEPEARTELDKPFVILLRDGFKVSDPNLDWWLVGWDGDRRRWMLVEEAQADLRVEDDRGGLAWQPSKAVTSPTWVERVQLSWKPYKARVDLGELIYFSIVPPQGTSVDYAVCNGKPLTFTDGTRTRTLPIRHLAEHAGSGCQLRVGLTREGARGVLRKSLKIPTRGLAEYREEGGEFGWLRCHPRACMTVSHAAGRSFRTFTDGPNTLMEGHVLHRLLVPQRRGPLGRLLGTGGTLRLTNAPFDPTDDFPIAAHAVDFGIVEWLNTGEGTAPCVCLGLTRALAPTDQYELILWSDRYGLERIEGGRIDSWEDGGVWSVVVPWKNAPGSLICAIAYQGYCKGFGWNGDSRQFFSAEHGAHPTLTPKQRLALIRWFRLPGLMPDLRANQQPVLQAMAETYPADLLAVAENNTGLEDLPGPPLCLEESASGRGLFDVIVRDLLFDFRPNRDQSDAIEQQFGSDAPGRSPVDRYVQLFLYLPMLAARVLQAGHLSNILQKDRPQARQQIRFLRLTTAGLPLNATNQRFQERKSKLRERASSTLSQGMHTPDEFLTQGLAKSATEVVIGGRVYNRHERRNLLVGLNSAAFRHFLSLLLLEDLEEQF